MLIYIIRHGETDMNKESVLQGHTDIPLNQSGRDLAAVTGREMKDIRFDACISSPLVRALETAEIVLRESGHAIAYENGETGGDTDSDRVVPLTLDERIMEMNCGEWELRKLSEMGEEAVRLFTFDPFNFPQFPGGEDFHDVRDRAQDFLNELMARDDDKNYLVATHGCALRAMLNPFYDDPDNFWHDHVPYNCCVNIIEAHGGKGRLIADDKVYYPRELIVDRYKYEK